MPRCKVKESSYAFKGLKRSATQKRKCLRCDREFNSSGPENRLCDQCNWWINTPEDSHGGAVMFGSFLNLM